MKVWLKAGVIIFYVLDIVFEKTLPEPFMLKHLGVKIPWCYGWQG